MKGVTMSNREDIYALSGDEIVVIRKRFLFHTKNNHCAAAVLDMFVARIATREEFSRFGNEPTNYYIETSVTHLTNELLGLFSYDQVVEALNLLINSKLLGNCGKAEGTKDRYTFMVHRGNIDMLSKIYAEGKSQQSEVERLREVAGLALSTPSSNPPERQEETQQTTTREPRTKRRSESKRIEYHNNRATRVGLPGTLTVEQWAQTLEHFNHKCALCSDGAYDVLEHFIPIIHGGGTTEYNCIPACTRCNRIKHDSHPSMIAAEYGMEQALHDVQMYLESRRVTIDEVAE